MSLNKLTVAAVALVALVALTLMGIAVCDGYGYTLRDKTTLAEATANVTTMLLLDERNVRVGAANAYPYLQELSGCTNSSAVTFSEAYYTISEGRGLSDRVGGYIYLNAAGVTAGWNNTYVNCSHLVYLGSNTESAISDNFRTGLALFGTFAGILVLAIIGIAIVRLFKKED